MTGNIAIEVKNLSHSYDGKTVFENLNFQLEEGRILGLLGKNGCGKSTTINILNGFLEPLEGEAMIYGENTQNLPPERKARVGILIEGHVQYSFMNIHQIEKFYRKSYSNWKPEYYWELIEKLDVSKNQKISSMSRGQQSQVALGLIMAQDPDLLILDDFSMGLDSGYRRLFIDYLRDYAKAGAKTIFTTSHIIQDIERLIDDVLIMDNKKVVVQQSLNSFMSSVHCYKMDFNNTLLEETKSLSFLLSAEKEQDCIELMSYKDQHFVQNYFEENGIDFSTFKEVETNLEDVFIAITGKY